MGFRGDTIVNKKSCRIIWASVVDRSKNFSLDEGRDGGREEEERKQRRKIKR